MGFSIRYIPKSVIGRTKALALNGKGKLATLLSRTGKETFLSLERAAFQYVPRKFSSVHAWLNAREDVRREEFELRLSILSSELGLRPMETGPSVFEEAMSLSVLGPEARALRLFHEGLLAPKGGPRWLLSLPLNFFQIDSSVRGQRKHGEQGASLRDTFFFGEGAGLFKTPENILGGGPRWQTSLPLFAELLPKSSEIQSKPFQLTRNPAAGDDVVGRKPNLPWKDKK
jgi:hypothetical protein